MRILFVQNHYLAFGGEDQTFEDEIALLTANGHSVGRFESSSRELLALNPVHRGLRTIWSAKAYRALRGKLADGHWDVIHVHNCFPNLSPSIFHAAHAAGTPIVQTLHNYRLLCTNACLYRNEKPCESCVGSFAPWRGITRGCYQHGRLADAALAGMVGFHRAIATWTKRVTRYIALTEFARLLFIRGGLPGEKIDVLPTFVDPDPGIGDGIGGFALFAGRHSREKGVDVLLEAWRKMPPGAMPLKIVGTGPDSERIVSACRAIENVEFLGKVSRAQLDDLFRHASVLVFPSLWYEGTPRTIVEAFASGTPVVASDLGAMSAMIETGESGLKFAADDSADLAKQISRIQKDPALRKRLRTGARKRYETSYTAERHYDGLLGTYRKAIQWS